ncbi:MAG: mandelate racemase/muconate lactonizing enzyme family protein [Acidobacteria bacterium]|nr:mandelate racemase/muconate lactonizing enzyme family protein [Acidobacteriota bacterium]
MKKGRTTATQLTRRQMVAAAGAAASLPVAASPVLATQPSGAAERSLRVEELALTSVRVSERTAWMFVHLRTNRGLAGLGECSVGNRRELPALNEAFEVARGRSPFDIEAYRAAGRARAAAGSIFETTAFSAIEQALWDLVGKAVDAPVHQLAGGRRPTRTSTASPGNALPPPSRPMPAPRSQRASRRSRPPRSTAFRRSTLPRPKSPRPPTSALPASRRSGPQSGRMSTS